MSNFYKNDIFDRFMTIEEAADFWDMSAPGVKKYCQQGKIDCRKIGTSWIIDKLQPRPYLRKNPSGMKCPPLLTSIEYCNTCEQYTPMVAIDPENLTGKGREWFVCETCYTGKKQPKAAE